MMKNNYINNYPTCEETWATLRIYYQIQKPDFITEFLGIDPSSIQIKGESMFFNGIKTNRKVSKNGWFLTSQKTVKSRDSRKHIDYLIKKILPVKNKILKLKKEMSADIDISCYWRSKQGHGGPTLSCGQFARLAELELDLWYDFYV